MTKKSFVSVLLIISLMFTLISYNPMVYADADDDVQSYLESEVVDDREYFLDDETGFVRTESELYPSQATTGEGFNGTLPAIYQTIDEVMEKYPDTRNQGSYGACWAFAVTACAEFDLVKQGVYTKEDADFSELQLIYAKYNTVDEPLGFAHGDTVKYLNEDINMMEAGGDIYATEAMLANWKSFTFEQNLPYTMAEQLLSSGFDSSVTFKNDAAQLKNMYSLDIRENPKAVKKAIMEHGAVYAEYYSTWFGYNEEYNTFYEEYMDGYINHAVAIVGWDDSIPKEHFNEWKRPAGDGAWLIRNSWTTETGASEESYFYLSYYDKNLSNCFAFDFDVNQYDHNYQHDGSVSTGLMWTEAAANVFSMKNINKTKSQSLEAIMISMSIEEELDDQRFKVQIYTGVDDINNPKSGYLNKEATTYFSVEGYGTYTVALRKPVIVAPGEKFSIVVTPVNKDFYVGAETGGITAMGLDENAKEIPWYETAVVVDRGESYYMNDGKWMDMADSKYNQGNLNIKALVNDCNTEKYLIEYKMNGGDNPDTNPSGYFEGESVTFNNPIRNGYKFMGWYKDSNFKNRITGIPSGTTDKITIYAKWKLFPVLKISNDEIMGEPVLTWKAIPNAKKYEVYRAKSKAGVYKKIYTTTDTEYIDSNTTVGKNYYYKVKVILNSGKIGFSDIKLAAHKCERPVISVKTLKESGKPRVSWGTVEGGSKYILYRSTSKDGKYINVHTAYDQGYFIDKNAKPGKKYYYKMKAFCKSNSKANSFYSLQRYITCDCARPEVSVKLSAKGKPILSWKKISGAVKYEVYRSEKKTGKFVKIYTTKNLKYTNTKAKKGKTYYYKVKAICSNTNGNSAFSKCVSKKSK